MPTVLRRSPLVLVAVLLVGLSLAGSARASSAQESIIQDDGQLLYGTAAEQRRGLDDIARLGADTVKALVSWRRFAPRAESARRPAFDATDPSAYPDWGRLDDLVRGARQRGLDVMLVPTGPVPRWADGCRSADRTCRPNVVEFGRFAAALARRYSGEAGGPPVVSRWAIWNEPNHGGWLTPQYVRSGSRTITASPRRYRDLARAAIAAIRRQAGHERDRILLGETAPIARRTGALARRTIGPLRFLRDVLCLDARGARLTGRAAREQGCTRFRTLQVNGISHHPYYPAAGGPSSRIGPDDATVDGAARFAAILLAGGRTLRIPVGLGLWYTEFGMQTNPPDDLVGVSPALQAAELNRLEHRAFRQPLVRSVAQYQLQDARRVDSFNAGLRYASGRVKPAWAAYRLPFDLGLGARRLRVFAHLRPTITAASRQVELQHAAPRRHFRTVARLTAVNARGYVTASVARRAGLWRLRWSGGRATMLSRPIRIP